MSARDPRPDPHGGLAAGESRRGLDARAAFEQGLVHEEAGDLEPAARWFRRAAEVGHPEAALRLGRVLGRLADRQGPVERTGVKTKQSPELLVAEAARWLSGVKAGPDTIELITDMLNRQQRLAARRMPTPLNPR